MMRYLSAGLVVASCALVCSSPAAAQSTTLTATFSRGAIAEYSNGPNGTDNGALFSSLNIASMSISQLSNNGSWGGTQGNDTTITAKITFTNGSTTTFPAAINWVKNAGGGQFDWIGITIGAGTTVNDGYNLTPGKSKTYVLQFPQSSLNLSTLLPNDLDGSANAGAAINALNLYFPSSIAAPPVISGPGGTAISAVSVNENQTGVTTLSANKQVSWAITGGSDGAKFAISSTGVITFLTAPDYEAPSDSDRNNTYVLQVQATDTNGGVTTQTITVTVLNLDDTAPVVTSNQNFSYAENRAAGDTVASVVATDNTAVTQFRFAATGTQTSADGYYTIDASGIVRITAAGVAAGVPNNDFEIAPNSFTYAVQAGDAANNWSAATNIALTVTDADDTAPVVTAGQSFSYAENRSANAQIGSVAAFDSVGVTTYRFSASGTQTSADGYYTLDNNGIIRITAAGVAAGVANNDYEISPNSFTYGVQAGDAAGNWSAAESVTLNVTNLDDSAPVIGTGQAFSYAENQATGALLGTVAASDDSGVSDFRFTATSTSTSEDGYYTVDATGRITLTAAGAAAGAASNDYEITPNSFTYGLQARDAAGNWSASANVILNVTNVDDSAPAISTGQSFSYAENRAVGTLLGTVTASDDTGVTEFRFTATGTSTSSDGFFNIDSAGRLTLTAAGAAAGVAANDFEVTPNSFIHGIEARDAVGNWSASANVALNVTDLDDTAPVITAGQSFSYAENQAANAVLGTVAASDAVGVTGFRFAATGTQTSADGLYAIDNAGVIHLTAAGAAGGAATNDFETSPNSFSYDVEARDAADNWSAPISVTLNVTDVNEVVNGAPSVSVGQLFVYAENRSANAVIGTVAASDDNGVTAFRFAATGTQTSTDGYYSIDSSGLVRLTAAGAAAGVATNDFEVAPNSFNYWIEAGDAGGLWSAATTVTFDVSDLDDTAPSIAAGQTIAYSENQVANAVVGAVAASDAVGVTSFRFTASGIQTSADGYYTIDDGGVVRITAAGVAAGVANNDYEVAPNAFAYDIEAGDAASNWSAANSVALNVTDLPDTAPVLTGPGGSTGPTASINVPEGTTTVTQVTANVPISSWTIVGGNDQGRFQVDGNGNITFVAAPDYEAPSDSDGNNSYVLVIEGIDANGNRTTQTITVNVTDRPDTPPVLSGPGGSTGPTASINVLEGTTTVTQLTANVPISSWTIVGGNDQGRFQVDGNGSITFVAAPDYEAPSDSDTNNSYVLVIEGIDANGNRTTQTITVNVTDRPDTPPIISGPEGATGATASVSVPEGTTAVATMTANVPISSWVITGGNDQGRFTIDAQGNLRFVAAPDYERPADSDANNSYVLVIEGTDANGNKATQTITVLVTNVADTPPAITGPSGGAGALASAISVNEGTTNVTTLAASVPVIWSIVGGNDRGQFVISPTGVLTFVAAPNYEAPADSDKNNSYVLMVQARDANGNVSVQTITVTVLNVDELQQKLNEIGGNLRANLRNQAFSSLSTMLSFNEGLLGLDNSCAGVGSKRLSGGVNANEQQQDANLRYRRDLSSCEARTRVFAEGGVGFSRVDEHWSTRGLASVRVEQRIGSRTVLGAALIGTAASDDLASFAESSISDRSLQLNVYGRTHLTERLRFAAFGGVGRSWYDFKLKHGGLALDGDMNGKRHLYGAALSGDIDLGGLRLTTDAILSRAVEKLGSASLDGNYAGETRSNMLFRLGRVDITRLSVPVHVPITFDQPRDGREATRLDISPGLLCQDTAQDSSALDCGYQLGFKFRLAPSLRSLLRAEARTEAVDGYLLSSLTVGFEHRFGSADALVWSMDVSRKALADRNDNRMMFRLGLGR